MICCVTGVEVPDVAKKYTAFMFRVKQSQKNSSSTAVP
jgi:hypothetical protein